MEEVRQLSELVPSEGLAEDEDETTMPAGGVGVLERGHHAPQGRRNPPAPDLCPMSLLPTHRGDSQALGQPLRPGDRADSCAGLPSSTLNLGEQESVAARGHQGLGKP